MFSKSDLKCPSRLLVLAALSACAAPAIESSATNVPAVIELQTADGITVYGERYFGRLGAAAPLILLFHQGGSNGRAEYGPLAPWLNAAGYRAIAWDQRTGGTIHGGSNRTRAGLPSGSDPDFCEAWPDLVAALDYVTSNDIADEVIVWGSSYSGALVFRLAAEYPQAISGVVAISPASGTPMRGCLAEQWLDRLRSPALVLHPRSEMERESTKRQEQAFAAAGVPHRVIENGVHGSSLLVDERTGHDMSEARDLVVSWLDEIGRRRR